MRKSVFILLLLSLNSFCQNFTDVDKIVESYPKLISADDLAKKINTDFSSESEKVRAVYSWLAYNIRYDLAEFYNPTQPKRIQFSYSTEDEKQEKLQAIRDKIVNETLSTRKAVCEGYAQVFHKVCSLMNIQSEIIKGYVRNSFNEIGKPSPNTNHAWNAVKINDKWMYMDATWGAGYEINGRWQRSFNDYFFDIPKDKLMLTHYPDESLWQLRVKRMTKEAFYNQPIYSHSFLKSDIKLVKPSNGILRKDKNDWVEIALEDFNKKDNIYIGFIGERFAKKPELKKVGDTTTVRVQAPKSTKALFLLLNGESFIEFSVR